jgi:hypothetical protein
MLELFYRDGGFMSRNRGWLSSVMGSCRVRSRESKMHDMT